MNIQQSVNVISLEQESVINIHEINEYRMFGSKIFWIRRERENRWFKKLGIKSNLTYSK